MLHQDGSRYEWLARQQHDLIVSLDDATGAIDSAFLVAEEDTMSSLAGVAEVIDGHGLFNSLYTDRGSYYWHTPKAGRQGGSGQPHPVRAGDGGAGDRDDSGLFPGSAWALRTRLPHSPGAPTERTGRRGDHRRRPGQSVPEAALRPGLQPRVRGPGGRNRSAFVPWIGTNLKDILCLQEERSVRPDNCVAYKTSSCRSRLIAIAAITSKPRCASTNIRITPRHLPRSPLLGRTTSKVGELKTKVKSAA